VPLQRTIGPQAMVLSLVTFAASPRRIRGHGATWLGVWR
jgi:hypothetical protein